MNARLAALADALDRIPRQRLPLSPDESNACREAAAILRALAEQEPVAQVEDWPDDQIRRGIVSLVPIDDLSSGTLLYTLPKEADPT